MLAKVDRGYATQTLPRLTNNSKSDGHVRPRRWRSSEAVFFAIATTPVVIYGAILEGVGVTADNHMVTEAGLVKQESVRVAVAIRNHVVRPRIDSILHNRRAVET